MSLKLGNTAINKLYLGATEIKKAYLGSNLVYDNSFIPLYNDISVAYTLRQLPMSTLWTKAVLRLRRSSDSDQRYIFFDTNGEISLNSPTNTISSTPSATTLGTWVGVDDAFVSLWFGITPDNTFSYSVGQGVATVQPKFISGGTILTKNSKPVINFDGINDYMSGAAISELDVGNDFTILSVSHSNQVNGLKPIFASTTLSDRLVLFNDRGVGKEIFRVRASSTNYKTLYITQQDTANQKLLSSIVESSNVKAYYNGTFQDSNTWSGIYDNSIFQIGRQLTSAYMNGGIQEIIIFPTDKTADLTELDTDINDYYNIY